MDVPETLLVHVWSANWYIWESPEGYRREGARAQVSEEVKKNMAEAIFDDDDNGKTKIRIVSGRSPLFLLETEMCLH